MFYGVFVYFYSDYSLKFYKILVSFSHEVMLSHTMASLYKQPKSPYWWLKRKDNKGKWIRASTKLRHDSSNQTMEAERIKAQASLEEAELIQSASGFSSPLFKDWASDWLVSDSMSSITKMNKWSGWKVLSKILDSLGIAHPIDVDYRVANLIYSKLLERGYTNQTIKTRIGVLSLVIDEAIRRGFTKTNPIKLVRIRGGAKIKQKTELSYDDQVKIEEHISKGTCKPWIEVSFLLGLYQGARISETIVTPKNFDLESNMFTIVQKGDRVRAAPIHPRVRPIAERICSGEVIEYPLLTSMSCNFSFVMKTIGVPITHHCLRVTCITRLHRAQVPYTAIMKYVGHTTISAHLIYEKLKPSDLAYVAEKLV